MERISLGLLEEARKMSQEELAKQQRTLVNVKPSGECVFGAVAAAIGGETDVQLKQHLLNSIGPVYGAYLPLIHTVKQHFCVCLVQTKKRCVSCTVALTQ